MSLTRSSAVTLVTIAMTLGTTAPALAFPARDVGVSNTPTPVIVTSAGPSTGDDGVGTPAVLLITAGALLAGAAAGFGGARASAAREPLHPH